MLDSSSSAPPSRDGLRVMAVGFDGVRRKLIRQIESHGFHLVRIDGPEALGSSHIPVLVYSPKLGDGARRVLSWMADRCLDSPVVVLTDHADFGHYYDVMSAGAYEYIDLSESSGLDRLRLELGRAAEA